MTIDPLAGLMAWYRAQCNGDWEHQYGVEIGTLDNPGWRLEIDLTGTALEGETRERTVEERSDDDWIQTWSDGRKFEAACGPINLGEAIEAFRAFVNGKRAE